MFGLFVVVLYFVDRCCLLLLCCCVTCFSSWCAHRVLFFLLHVSFPILAGVSDSCCLWSIHVVLLALRLLYLLCPSLCPCGVVALFLSNCLDGACGLVGMCAASVALWTCSFVLPFLSLALVGASQVAVLTLSVCGIVDLCFVVCCW